MLDKSVAVTIFYRYAFFIINSSAFIIFLYNNATHVTTAFSQRCFRLSELA